MRRNLLLALAVGMLLWLPVSILEDMLLKTGILNTKDLKPFVGTETGTASEHLLNVWHWDAWILLLTVMGAFCFLTLLVMVASGRHARNAKGS